MKPSRWILRDGDITVGILDIKNVKSGHQSSPFKPKYNYSLAKYKFFTLIENFSHRECSNKYNWVSALLYESLRDGTFTNVIKHIRKNIVTTQK